MPKIKIDDLEYNTEDLSENGLAQLKSLQYLETQLQKLRNDIAVYQTAQRTYIAALQEEIKKSGIEPIIEGAVAEDQ
ncbi:DUF6447 family protein [Rhodobacteraceae bacterium]|nr:DUF6447 family protein [Paracoccaceae bacterium]